MGSGRLGTVASFRFAKGRPEGVPCKSIGRPAEAGLGKPLGARLVVLPARADES